MQPTTGGCFPPFEGGQEGSKLAANHSIRSGAVHLIDLLHLCVLFWMDDLLFLGGNVTPHAGSMTLE